MVVQGRTPTNISIKWAKTATRRTEWGGEMMKLEAELLQGQEEEGGERRNQPAHNVRVEKDELSGGKVVEGDSAGPDLPGLRRRGPSQKAPHRVQLNLALESAWERKQRHGECWGWIAMEQRREGSRAQRGWSQKRCGDEGALRRLLLARAKR
jgi:hypothetical protein